MDAFQKLFLFFGALVLLYQSFRGWRLGPVRQVVRVVALFAAYLDARWFSALTVPHLRALGLPDFMLQVVGSLLLGLVTYLSVIALGGILFKKTTDQRGMLAWFAYGATGSLIGIGFGLVIMLIVAVGIRLLGTLADGAMPKVALRPTPPAAPGSSWVTEVPGRPSTEQAPPAGSGPGDRALEVVSGMAQFKRSLDNGLLGEIIQTVDPISRETYEITAKIGRLSASANAIPRFLQYPGATDLVTDPDVIALRDDPEIAKMVQEQNLIGLTKNVKIQKACNNPKLKEKLSSFDLRKALDFALER